VENSFGATSVTMLEAIDVDEALTHIITSILPFDCWYRERLQELHGINLTGYEKYVQTVQPIQNQELLFEWTLTPDVDG